VVSITENQSPYKEPKAPLFFGNLAPISRDVSMIMKRKQSNLSRFSSIEQQLLIPENKTDLYPETHKTNIITGITNTEIASKDKKLGAINRFYSEQSKTIGHKHEYESVLKFSEK